MRAWPFIAGLGIGWLVATVLLVLDVAEPFALATAWVAFCAAAALLWRVQMPRPRR